MQEFPDMKRRVLLRGSLAAGAVSVAVAAGLLAPRAVLAAWSQEAFGAKDLAGAMGAVAGAGEVAESADISIKAPPIAENGAVVPVTVETALAGVESIAILVEQNGTPLTAHFVLPEGTDPYISTRIKMAKTSNVVALVKVGGKYLRTQQEVKVTAGGCGG